MKMRAVFNRDGGTFRAMDLDAFARRTIEVFGEHGHNVLVEAVAGPEVIATLERAAQDHSADILLAGGGDGTVSAAAGIAWRAGIPLAVLPAGTMNLFARSLGVPGNLETALQLLAAGAVKNIDIATANERPFIHLYSVGFHPRLVRLRNGYVFRSRFGKMIASLRAMSVAARQPRRFPACVVADGEFIEGRFSALSVANNRLRPGLPPLAETLSGGNLAVYLARDIRSQTLLHLALEMMTSETLAEISEIEQLTAENVELRFPTRPARANALIDGELVPLPREVRIQIHPGKLKALMPADPEVHVEGPDRPVLRDRTAAAPSYSETVARSIQRAFS